MATQVSIDVITSAEAARALEPEWDALAVAHARTPFALPALALSWWQHMGRGELLLVAARNRSGELLAVGPFHQRTMGSLRVARWLGTGLGSVAELVQQPDTPEAASAIWRALAEQVQVLDLIECRDDGDGLLELRRSPDWTTELRVADLCPVLDLSRLTSLDEFLARGSLRRHLERRGRKVTAAGSSFAVEVVTDPEDLGRVLPEITEVYDESERAHPRQHLLADPWRPFVVAGLTAAAERGQLVVFVGRLDDRAVAFDVVLRIGTTLADWVGRYRPDAAPFSVGHLLIRQVVQWALDNGITTIVRKAGTASVTSSHRTSFTPRIIIAPTRTSAGAMLGYSTVPVAVV